MEYGEFVIAVVADDTGFRGRVSRFDRQAFTVACLTHTYKLYTHVDTARGYPTEAEAIENAKLIADAATPY